MSLFEMIHDFIQGVVVGFVWFFFFLKACIINILSPFGRTSLKWFYLILLIWLRLKGFLYTLSYIFFSAVKNFRSNFAGNFLLTSVPTALHGATYAEIWDWKSTLHHLYVFPAATRGEWFPVSHVSPPLYWHGSTGTSAGHHLEAKNHNDRLASKTSWDLSDRSWAHWYMNTRPNSTISPLSISGCKLRQECPTHMYCHKSCSMGWDISTTQFRALILLAEHWHSGQVI